jgi:hypothetical protein
LGRLLQSQVPTPVMTHFPPVGIQWLKGFMSVVFLVVCREKAEGSVEEGLGRQWDGAVSPSVVGMATCHRGPNRAGASWRWPETKGMLREGPRTVDAAWTGATPVRRASPRTRRRIAKYMSAVDWIWVNACVRRRKWRGGDSNDDCGQS